MDWLSNGISSAIGTDPEDQTSSFSLGLPTDMSSFTPTLPSSMNMFSEEKPSGGAESVSLDDGVDFPAEKTASGTENEYIDHSLPPAPPSATKENNNDNDDDEKKDQFKEEPRGSSRRLSAGEIIHSTIGNVQNMLHHGSTTRSSTFGENSLRQPRAFHKKPQQHSLVDMTTGTKMKRKKIQHVNLVPEKLRINLAYSELAEIKRKKTVGVKYNSATIFSLMWVGYILGSVMIVVGDNHSKICPSYFLFLGLRIVILIPSTILAYSWKRGWWSRSLPSPEVVGLVIATYIVIIISIGFCTVLNGTCGVRIPIVEGTMDVKLSGVHNVFYLRKETCEVLSADESTVEDDCDFRLVDRHTYFELNVMFWCGQLVLMLFGFTSLFKPSFHTTVFYTAIVWFVAAVGCWYQGFGFWNDRDRVFNSGIFTGIFAFTCAAAVNIYSAHVMHDLEMKLVISSHQLSDDRYNAPKGDNVVYVKADVMGASELTVECPAAMDNAVAEMLDVTQQLAKEYYGTSITLDDEIKQLMTSGKPLTAEETKHIQELMKAGKRSDCDFLFAFHDVFDAVSFALTLQNELMDIDWEPEILQAQCGEARTEGVMITSMEPESRARAMTVASYKKETKNANESLNLTAFHGLRVQMAVHIGSDKGGIKGPTIAFTEALVNLAGGGQILLSPTVADILAGALDQLSNSLGKSEQKNVPRLVHMGGLVFPGSEIYHKGNDESKRSQLAAASPSTPSVMKGKGGGGDVELGSMLLADGTIATPTPPDTPIDIFHIFNEPLFGRHLKWDDINFELPNAVVHSVGYYDAPVKRENRPEFAVVIFGDVNGSHELQSQNPAVFTQAVGVVNQIMAQLLVKHRGYQVPQREGHYMHTFSSPKDAVAYHSELQKALLTANWPESYKTNPLTKPVYYPNDQDENKELLYNGLTVSLGMSVGVISKSLERSRANYLGPTCNRSARVSGLAKQGQLLMCLSEYESQPLEHVREGANGTMPKVGAKIMLENQILKGIKGTHSIVFLETDEFTLKRRDFPRPKVR
jgi:class 3 adenylate cyclase